MRLARIDQGRGPEYAVSLDGSDWLRLADAGIAARTTREAIEGLAGADRTVLSSVVRSRGAAAGGVALACPVVPPGKVLGIGLNYADHARDTGAEIPARPAVFSKLPSSLCGPGDPIRLPAAATEVDYEAELAVVVGLGADAVEDPLDAVFGYAIANDVSARDWQRRGEIAIAKGFDGFCPLGPWITSRDAVGDPGELAIASSVNGDAVQRSSTREMIRDVRTLVDYLRRLIRLDPGDVILTGTPGKLPDAPSRGLRLAPGDVVRCEIAGLGCLESPVA